MTKYRVIRRESVWGKQYEVQQRYLFFFWAYLDGFFNTKERAIKRIELEKKHIKPLTVHWE